FLVKKIDEAQYSIYVTLLMVISSVPTMPLQMVLAQQTASALARDQGRQLAGMIRLAWMWTFILWLIAAGVVFLFNDRIVHAWGLTNPMALWVTIAAVIFSLWSPMF